MIVNSQSFSVAHFSSINIFEVDPGHMKCHMSIIQYETEN